MRINSGARRGETQFILLTFASVLPIASLLIYTKDYYENTVHPREHAGKSLPWQSRRPGDPFWFVRSTK